METRDETIKQIETQNDQTGRTRSSSDSNAVGELRKPTPSYLGTVMELIKKSLELSNQAPLEDKELGKRAVTWSEILFENISEEWLKHSFNAVFKVHKSSFPISAYEVNEGYRIVQQLRSKQEDIKRQKELTQLTNNMRSPGWKSCEYCFDSGMRRVPNPNDPREMGVIRCNRCGYWERKAKFLGGQK